MIEGKAVSLKRLKNKADFNFSLILKWLTDPAVMRYVGFYKKVKDFATPEEVEEFFAKLSDGLFFGIYLKNSTNMIGWCSLSHFSSDECELGIFIGEKEYWGKGIGTEATKILSNYALKTSHINQIILTTSESNLAGIKAYLKAGFNIESVISGNRKIFTGGRWKVGNSIKMSKHRKTLKFFPDLVELIKRGEKTSTWRLFDDKNLSAGDSVTFLVRPNLEPFAEVKITEVLEKPFGELSEEDKVGHEKYVSPQEMYKTFEHYYGQPVNKNTPVKIIHFNIAYFI